MRRSLRSIRSAISRFSRLSAFLAWVRLVRFRLGADGGPVLLRDRTALRVLSALAALIVIGGALSSLSAWSEKRIASGPSALVSSSAEDVGPSATQDAPDAMREVARPLVSHTSPVVPDAAELAAALGPAQTAGGPLSPGAAPYNEGSFAPLADAARQVDTALLQAAARLGLAPSRLEVLDSETRLTRAGQVYPFLRLAVRLDASSGTDRKAVTEKNFVAALRESLRVWAPRARLRVEGAGLYFVTADEEITHSVYCGSEPRVLPPLPLAAAYGGNGSRPRLTIVVDDMGESETAARKLLALPYPVTLSVWPRAARAAYVATLARERGRQVFLHQPMEPVGHAPGDAAPELLRVGMDPARLEEELAESLRLVPYVEGVNNHMGSRFTSDPASARALCATLRRLRPDILVLDSLTHAASVLYDEARRQGLAARRRALFLDDENGRHDKAAVLNALDRGLELAREHGAAVVIGHPRPATLAALAAWTGYRAGDVDIAPLAPWPDNTNGGASALFTEIP